MILPFSRFSRFSLMVGTLTLHVSPSMSVKVIACVNTENGLHLAAKTGEINN